MLTASFYSALSFTARGLRRLASTLTTVLRNRRALKQLSELDDYTLADIGLTRTDLINAHAQPIYRDPYLIDPFDARRRIHASELDVLARWPHMRPETGFQVKPEVCCAGVPAK